MKCDEVRRGHHVGVPGVFAVSYADHVHCFLFKLSHSFFCTGLFHFFKFFLLLFFFTGKWTVCIFKLYQMACTEYLAFTGVMVKRIIW